MHHKQLRALGQLFHKKRMELGFTAGGLAAVSGLTGSTVTRLEHGQIAMPRPEKLVDVARALGLNVADVLIRAGYSSLVTQDLPSTDLYLRLKYPNLPKSAIDDICKAMKATVDRYQQSPEQQLAHDPAFIDDMKFAQGGAEDDVKRGPA